MPSYKLFVTGASGYIGGSIIAELLAPKVGTPLKPSEIVVAVRNEEYIAKIAKLGVDVVNIPLADGSAVEKFVLDNGINFVVHTASAIDASVATPLIEALGKQRKKTGEKVYFIHTSGTSSYADGTGWKHGLVRDTDPIYDLEKSNPESYAIREANMTVTESAKQHDVIASIAVPPFVYGEGAGEIGRQTVVTPVFLKATIKLKTVHRFDNRFGYPAVHITDLADFYVRLIQRILSGSASDDSVSGYWLPVSHKVVWWDTCEEMGKALHARGLVDDPTPSVWASPEAAAEALEWPIVYISMVFYSTTLVESVRPGQVLGWKPKWTEEKYPESIPADIDAFLRLSKTSTTITELTRFIDAKKES